MVLENETSKRKLYLDNVRWITIMMVVLYHIFSYYNNVGIQAHFASSAPSVRSDGTYPYTFASLYQYGVYQWFMLLLFVIAGIAAYHSISAKGLHHFMSGRFQKLIVPSTAGIMLLWWIGGKVIFDQYNLSAVIPSSIRYIVYCLLGIQQFWFLHVLFFASVVLFVLKKIDPKDHLRSLFEDAPYAVNVFVLIILALPCYLSAQILNIPQVSMYRFGIYTFGFLAGYYIMSTDSMLFTLKKIGPASLLAGIGLTALYITRFYGIHYYSYEVLNDPLSVLSAWMMVLGIIGTSQYVLNFTNGFTRYMSRISFGVYCTHLTIMLCLNVLLKGVACVWNINLIYLLLAVSVYPLSIVASEVMGRIPVVNYLFFGMGITDLRYLNPLQQYQLQKALMPELKLKRRFGKRTAVKARV